MAPFFIPFKADKNKLIISGKVMFKLLAVVLVVGVQPVPFGERDRDRYNTRDYAIDDQPYIPRTSESLFGN